MNIQNAVGQSAAKLGAQQSHEPRQADQVDAAIGKLQRHAPIVFLARNILGRKEQRRQSPLTSNANRPAGTVPVWPGVQMIGGEAIPL